MTAKVLHLPSSVRTGGVALPRRAESQVTAEQEQMQQEMEFQVGRMDYFNAELSKLDRDLQVVLAKPTTTVLGLKPGYWHLVRLNPQGTYIKPIEGPNGEWRDLDSSVFDLAAEDDLWNDRTQRERRRITVAAQAEKERRIARERADRAAEFDARMKSILNTSISVPR